MKRQLPSVEISKTGRSPSVLFQTPMYPFIPKQTQDVHRGFYPKPNYHPCSLVFYANSMCKMTYFFSYSSSPPACWDCISVNGDPGAP